MTSIAEAPDRVVGLARGMRELVAAEAAESERKRTLTPAIVEAMWASRADVLVQPVSRRAVSSRRSRR